VAILGFILFGLVVGIIARLIVPGHQRIGLLMTAALGIIGSLIGGIVANALGTGDMFELNIIGSIVAIISAAVLVAAVTAGSSSSRRSGRPTYRH